jgi:4-amino-4-deoxy-L-arabinose transferase-like glycosyltransferase
VLLVVVLRLPALLAPRPIDDENMYAAVGIELAHGGLPYVSAIERKPPLLLWTYAAVLRVFGEHDWPALHAVASVWLLVSMLGLYWLARAWWDRAAGLTAALLYALFLPWGTYKDLAWNGEMLMNLPIIFGLLLAMRPRRSALSLAAAGALIGVASLLKQPAAISIGPLLLYVLLPSYRAAQGRSLGGALLLALSLALGFALTLGAMALLLLRLGILREALYWSVLDHDVPHGPLSAVFWQRALPASAGFAAACLPLLWGSYRAAADSGKYFAGRRPEYLALVYLLIAACIGTAASGRFYPHYFLQIIPVLCLFCAPVGAELWHARETLAGRKRFRAGTGYLAGTACVFFGIHAVACAGARAAGDVSAYLRAHAGASDRLFVWGQAPEIYVDSHCRPASRYITTFPLTGYVFASPLNQDPNYDTSDRIVPGSWAVLEHELSERAPSFIVDADGARAVPRYPIRNYPFLRGLLDQSYQQVARLSDGVIYRRSDAVSR